MPDPITPTSVFVAGNSTSAVGDVIRVTIYNGSTARGTLTGVLDSNKELQLDLSNSDISASKGDVAVITENGNAIGGTSVTLSSQTVEVTLAPTAVAFPSRSL